MRMSYGADSTHMVYPPVEYDWVSPHGSRTPAEYPYSHDEYFIWRDFEMRGQPDIDCYYTDRMSGWDREKYRRATEGKMTNWNSVPKTKKAAQEIVKAYFGADYECVGVVQSMNVSNGYPLGVFYIRRIAAKEPAHD